MSHYLENVRKELTRIVPASVISDVSCFVFYDHHPRDQQLIDITLCTRSGEVKEYYRRDMLSSVQLDCITKESQIKIFRNNSAALFYLVKLDDVLYILSRKDKLRIHLKVTNLERYDVNDSGCRGQASLKVVRKDDAVPLVFDDNLNILEDRELLFCNINADDSLPILTHLNRKLTEAKYSIKCNEKKHEELVKLRQLAAFSLYEKIHPNLDDSIYKKSLKEVTGVLNVDVQAPWVKLCNEKIVLILNVRNKNNDSIEDVHILLHSSVCSMVYKTMVFDKTSLSPFWIERHSQNIEPSTETSVLAVIDLEELKSSVISPIEFNGVISYKIKENNYFLPFNNVVLSSLDIMGEEFDVFSNNHLDSKSILAIMATSEKTNLIFRQIRHNTEVNIILPDVLHSHLHLDLVNGTDNIVVHRKCPYHILHGTMIVIKEVSNEVIFHTTVFTRSASQILALIHYIHDAVPFRILISTPNQKITAKNEEYSNYNEHEIDHTLNINYTEYAKTILTRTGMLLEYLDKSMIKMNESKDPDIKTKVGREIDLFADGVENYKEFRCTMLEESSTAVKYLCGDVATDDTSNIMAID